MGSITVNIGGMFSEKTENMIREVNKYSYGPKARAGVFVKPCKDTRNDVTVIRSHANREVTCVTSDTLMNFAKERIKYEKFLGVTPDKLPVIGIDEGQFFEDLAEGCELLAQAGYIVVVSALNGTYTRKPWPSVSQLLPLADHIIHSNSICQECSSHDGCYSWLKQIEPEVQDEVVIGGADKYMAICRSCYYRLSGLP